ncbi:MAG: AraC family transcriptional regulator [Verrucomicrobiota bacterium]
MKVQLELVPRPPSSSILCLSRRARVFDCPFHYHPEVELTLIQSGRGTRIVGDRVENFGAGDLCLLGSNLRHIYFSHRPGKAHAEIIQFLPETFGGLLAAPEMAGLARLLRRAGRGLCFPASVAREFDRLMPACREAKGPERMLCLLEMLTRLASRRDGRVLASPGFEQGDLPPTHARIDAVCRHILRRHAEPLPLAETARRAGYSPSAFSRWFRRMTGQNYSQFLESVRLGQACRRLAESDLSVAEICYASGFRNLSNFNRRFRAVHGRSPRQYRELSRREDQQTVSAR